MARAMKLEEYKAIRENSMKIGELYLNFYDGAWYAYRDAKQGRLICVSTFTTSLEAIRYAKEKITCD